MPLNRTNDSQTESVGCECCFWPHLKLHVFIAIEMLVELVPRRTFREFEPSGPKTGSFGGEIEVSSECMH